MRFLAKDPLERRRNVYDGDYFLLDGPSYFVAMRFLAEDPLLD
jgi:hypothetical protein